MDGFEVLWRIKDPDLKNTVVNDVGEVNYHDESFKYGVLSYLTKPIDLRLLGKA